MRGTVRFFEGQQVGRQRNSHKNPSFLSKKSDRLQHADLFLSGSPQCCLPQQKANDLINHGVLPSFRASKSTLQNFAFWRRSGIGHNGSEMRKGNCWKINYPCSSHRAAVMLLGAEFLEFCASCLWACSLWSIKMYFSSGFGTVTASTGNGEVGCTQSVVLWQSVCLVWSIHSARGFAVPAWCFWMVTLWCFCYHLYMSHR